MVDSRVIIQLSETEDKNTKCDIEYFQSLEHMPKVIINLKYMT